jgi:alkanesulfonate monooxygenase SsuD/methylene tetrahydromethanopterin reductase-like flavin-dependent oxidoreductase (luciferase family)
MTTLGAIFPPDLPPERLRAVALAADEAGLEQLWVWEDCFKESGVAAAAAVLAWTERLTVGIGLLPVPLRNVALTAMEVATLERLFPGRLVPGVGHGVLEWMAQVGARAESPMTLLREYTDALRRLLHGERVTTSGRYVQLDDVALDWPPSPPPPLLVGAVRSPVSWATALSSPARPRSRRWARRCRTCVADVKKRAGTATATWWCSWRSTARSTRRRWPPGCGSSRTPGRRT